MPLSLSLCVRILFHISHTQVLSSKQIIGVISSALAASPTPNNWYQSLDVLHPAVGRHSNLRITTFCFSVLYLEETEKREEEEKRGLHLIALDHLRLE